MNLEWTAVADQFSVRFDGPAVDEDNAIDASVFGTSLVSLADLIAEAQVVIDPEGPKYRVTVRTTGTGSFEVFMELTGIWDAVTSFFGGPDVQATAVMLQLFGPDGLLGLLRALRGRKPRRIVDRPEGQTTFYVEDEEFSVERTVGGLFSSKKVRRSFRSFTQPVSRNVVEELTVNLPGTAPAVITPDDRASLDTPIDDEAVTDQTVEMFLTIEAIRFRSNRWEFREPTIGLMWAAIEDEEFLRRVDSRSEQFEKGDLLRCLVRVRQWDEGVGNYKTEYTIRSVIDHLPSDQGKQLAIGDHAVEERPRPRFGQGPTTPAESVEDE